MIEPWSGGAEGALDLILIGAVLGRRKEGNRAFLGERLILASVKAFEWYHLRIITIRLRGDFEDRI